MKKLISILLVVCCMAALLSTAALGADSVGDIVLEFRTNVAGMTVQDYEKYIFVNSGNVYLNPSNFQINDYVGNVCLGKMQAGRTYTLTCTFYAEDGYEFPADFSAKDVQIICPSGCKVYSCQVAQGANGPVLSVYAQIRVDGSILQRISGGLADRFSKLRAWSPY